LVFGHRCSDERAAICLNQIQQGAPVRRPEWHAAREDVTKTFGDFNSNFIAARPDCRTNRHVYISGICAEFSTEAKNRFRSNSGECSTPTRMYRCDRTSIRVNQENRNTIRCSHSDSLSDLVRDESVALGRPIMHSLCIDDLIRVNLPKSRDR
jgi:hypothetical protein